MLSLCKACCGVGVGDTWDSNRYPCSVSPKSVRLIYILSYNFMSWKRCLTEWPVIYREATQSLRSVYLSDSSYLPRCHRGKKDPGQNSNQIQSPHFKRPKQCNPLFQKQGQGTLTFPKPLKSPLESEMLFFLQTPLVFSKGKRRTGGEGSNILST